MLHTCILGSREFVLNLTGNVAIMKTQLKYGQFVNFYFEVANSDMEEM